MNENNIQQPCIQMLTDFAIQKDRPDISKQMGQVIPSDQRFNLDQNFDKSTRLSKIKRVQCREFDSYGPRNSDILVAQGGNSLNIDVLNPRARPQDYYNCSL